MLFLIFSFSIASASFLDELDPLSTKKPFTKTPQSFLGENSALVNLDNLIKPVLANGHGQQPAAAFNPFGEMPQRTNLFQQQTQPVFIPKKNYHFVLVV